MATFVCRVQFLDDTDPFNSTNFPEPTRPPLYTFREDIPLINQIAGVHRLLKAPHKVGLINNRSYTFTLMRFTMTSQLTSCKKFRSKHTYSCALRQYSQLIKIWY